MIMIFFQAESQLAEDFKKTFVCDGISKNPETNNFILVIHCEFDLCKECNQPNSDVSWCELCNAKRYQQNFENWTSGNYNVDKFIQNTQLKCKKKTEVLEWIEHNCFENVKYLAKGGFGTVFKAIWKNGYIWCWDSKNNQWERDKDLPVVLKCLNNSQDITKEFLREVNIQYLFHNIIFLFFL